jgi:hypothetical protein
MITVMEQPASGSECARRYCEELVGPLLAAHRPDLSHAAARLGSGSDVLGLDDDRSRDHDWGLRLTVLVDDDDVAADVHALLAEELPDTFAGLPTRFATSWAPAPVHQVEVRAVDTFLTSRLGVRVDDLGDPLPWLALTGQSVLELTAGPVFCDRAGRLTAARRTLEWYPDDIWLYVLASGWRRLSQELPFVGRCADAGDDLGSRVVTARLVRDVMHLAFLVDRAWPPYPKWFGTAFAREPSASAGPSLAAALAAPAWQGRERSLVEAIEVVHATQRSRGLPCADVPVVPFWDRPYRTVAPEVAGRLTAAIADPVVASLPAGVGSIEQWVDNVDVLSHPGRRAQVAAAWRAALTAEG